MRVVLRALLALFLATAAQADSFQSVPLGSFTPFTCTATAASGTITTVSCSLRWQQTGKRIDINGAVTVTTNGSGATALNVTLPVATAGTQPQAFIVGRSAAGASLQGYALQSTSTVQILTYNNAYPVDGTTLYFSGSYEAQ